ncbi:AraC family transcriptional regulator [Paenibacillus taichungensis]|uniref:AraC family transcriptional regulator n=1 Tax=Paenibacillus taichungensis TaxID=484184 RepID=A0ABX2MFZ6_9BACL|nr:GyrI-like domain-containing protein [Paenibacillus taichungensis]MDR9745272.1 GyrI-like domain-containing protein [Paenibacillus taichungensis]NUU53836.1 AraC family transcriptional regulator [Paenibacillus taichungensis]
MEAKVVTLPAFQVVGYKIEATVEAFEAGLGKIHHEQLHKRKEEIQLRKNDNVILMQIYPMDADFNPKEDVFTHLIGYEVLADSAAPPDMILHAVKESQYVTCTHKGFESELDATYDYLYGQWISETGYELKDYDFEIWDERYQPDHPNNEIDLFVALQ